MMGKTFFVTVQPKAGRWMKHGYFGIEVYIQRPSSLGLDGGAYCLPTPGGGKKSRNNTGSLPKKSTLNAPYAMKCFTTERILFFTSNHRKAPVPMPDTLDRTTKEATLEHGADVELSFWFV